MSISYILSCFFSCTNTLGQRCQSIGSLFRSLCLQRCVLWPNGAGQAYNVYRSQIGMWGRHFDWYHFRPPLSQVHPNPPNGGGGDMGGHNLTLEFRSNGGRWTKTLFCGIGKSWVGFRLVQIPMPYRSPNPQNWGSQNSPIKLQPHGCRWSNILTLQA